MTTKLRSKGLKGDKICGGFQNASNPNSQLLCFHQSWVLRDLKQNEVRPP